MKAIKLARLAVLVPCLSLYQACAQTEVAGERVTEENGVYAVCGEGNGLAPCRDLNGQTYAEEVRGPSIDSESSNELAAEAARVRHESPEQLQQTIGEMESGLNPDPHATEGLPH